MCPHSKKCIGIHLKFDIIYWTRWESILIVVNRMGYMGRIWCQSGITLKKPENFVPFGPLGPLKVVLALWYWYQNEARYVLDPVGVYPGGWDGLQGRIWCQSGITLKKPENFVPFSPLGPAKVVLALWYWYQNEARYVLDSVGVYPGG